MMPNVNRSERASTCSPRTCSGDMYSGVPINAPVCVVPPNSSERAIPKSITEARPCWSTMMFCGFKSRWTTPSACAASRARQTC